jgi:hypothetical protein
LTKAVIANFYPGDEINNPDGRGLSCRTDPKVKEVVILASDGIQNRDISNQRNYRCPTIDYTGGGCVDEIWYPYGDRSELYNNFCDLDYHFGILPNGQIVQDDQKITFYTIGMGNPETGQSLDSEWVQFLKDIAYNWGSKEGAYYHVPSVDKLYDVFEQIADIYIKNKPANSAIVTVKLTDNFEFIGSTPLPTSISLQRKQTFQKTALAVK